MVTSDPVGPRKSPPSSVPATATTLSSRTPDSPSQSGPTLNVSGVGSRFTSVSYEPAIETQIDDEQYYTATATPFPPAYSDTNDGWGTGHTETVHTHDWPEAPSYDKYSHWWDFDKIRMRGPGYGMLPVLTASKLHHPDHELFKVSPALPDATRNPSEGSPPEGFVPPTLDDLREAIPHQNAYYCKRCNGWVLIQKTKGKLVPMDSRRIPIRLSTPHRSNVTASRDCARQEKSVWHTAPPDETHHFHWYPSLVWADRISPPFQRPDWDEEGPPCPDQIDMPDDQKALAWADENFHTRPQMIQMDADLLDIYMCCQCSVNILATKTPIAGVIPTTIINDLARERNQADRGPLRVVLAMETVCRLVALCLLWNC